MDRNLLTYTVSFERNAAGRYAVTFPAFPGLEALASPACPYIEAVGESMEEAREMAVAKLASRVYELRKHAQPLPEDKGDSRPHVARELATVELQPRSVEARIKADQETWVALASKSRLMTTYEPVGLVTMWSPKPRWLRFLPLRRWLIPHAVKLFGGPAGKEAYLRYLREKKSRTEEEE
ncbi:MAG: hypothetical protein AB1486_32015 [Planctomycetota bacterium]